MTDADIEKLRTIEKRVRSTICNTYNSRSGHTIEGRITQEDFNTLLSLLEMAQADEREKSQQNTLDSNWLPEQLAKVRSDTADWPRDKRDALGGKPTPDEINPGARGYERITILSVGDLIRDHKEGLLSQEILAHTNPIPNSARLTAEILKLDKMIDAEPMGPRHDDLCSAFRALNWARDPKSFVPPSECVIP